MLIRDFELSVLRAKKDYKKENHNNPKYIVLNKNTHHFISEKIGRRSLFGLVDKKIYRGLYIAIDNELEDYDFAILG